MTLYRKFLSTQVLAAVALYTFFTGTIPAQAASVSSQAQVPTTHILAIGKLTGTATPSQRKAIMPQEVRDTVNLALAGKIDQWWAMQDRTGVIFLLNVTSPDEANAMLSKLPLGKAGLMRFTLIPVGPLSPLRILTDNH
ncbi:hypothetical protein AA101099_1916 [Neoasaia chiangmaiensis NBRC 101099]|uniref:muconolactone Delta-isomerase family protein n=1 Tax=Neoasaia chiangmaiensis TaxID=320497 RepID=UPI00119334D9|nr:muconolactone Delta-isomerase family protein [Neoasaia chiangmaiensis]GBR40004.1 hypothetical protein AA101099_1916 [Neoasaia chiangmaiensis NBRC 101099]GEN14840.1 hypothetical protein NCH01_12710 [Neoasaia chiangmaiensis]